MWRTIQKQPEGEEEACGGVGRMDSVMSCPGEVCWENSRQQSSAVVVVVEVVAILPNNRLDGCQVSEFLVIFVRRFKMTNARGKTKTRKIINEEIIYFFQKVRCCSYNVRPGTGTKHEIYNFGIYMYVYVLTVRQKSCPITTDDRTRVPADDSSSDGQNNANT